jgi:hypothetical protein
MAIDIDYKRNVILPFLLTPPSSGSPEADNIAQILTNFWVVINAPFTPSFPIISSFTVFLPPEALVTAPNNAKLAEIITPDCYAVLRDANNQTFHSVKSLALIDAPTVFDVTDINQFKLYTLHQRKVAFVKFWFTD